MSRILSRRKIELFPSLIIYIFFVTDKYIYIYKRFGIYMYTVYESIINIYKRFLYRGMSRFMRDKKNISHANGSGGRFYGVTKCVT